MSHLSASFSATLRVRLLDHPEGSADEVLAGANVCIGRRRGRNRPVRLPNQINNALAFPALSTSARAKLPRR